MQLRPYQLESIALLKEGFALHRRQILCLPTGAGKTVIFTEIALRAALKGTVTLILTDRIELLRQTLSVLLKKESPIQILIAARKIEFNIKSPITVAMVETISRRELTSFDPDLIIIDECHKANFSKVIKRWVGARVIGVTATPIGTHLHKYYGGIVNNIDIQELIKQGYLCPVKAFQMQDDFSDVQIKGGEFDSKGLFTHYNKRLLYKGVVDQWLDRAKGLKTLVFCVNISHAERTAEEFRERGIDARVVTSQTEASQRSALLNEFSKGVFPVLVNCGILTAGYDEPSIKCIVMNRATMSLPLWLQCCGRGSRPFPGKDFFIVLDFGMNHSRHGRWDDPREWKLMKPREKATGAAPTKECPSCNAMLFASAKICQYCGHIFEKKEADNPEGVMVEVSPHVPTDLKGKRISELTVEELLSLEKARKFKATFIWRVLRTRANEDLDFYAKEKGYSRGWLWRQKSDTERVGFKDYRL